MAELDCLVVGAGPAGVTAALHLARSGIRLLLVDDRPQAGGMAFPARLDDDGAWLWPDRFYRGGALREALERRPTWFDYWPGHRVEAIEPGPAATVRTLSSGECARVAARCILLATGSAEIAAALPARPATGVFGLTDPELLVDQARERPGVRVAVAGMGPLLWFTAARLAAAGIALAAVIDAAPRAGAAEALGLIRQPGLLAQGLGWMRAVWSSKAPILHRAAVVAAEGQDRLAAVQVAAIDPEGRPAPGDGRRLEAGLLGIGYGLRPRTALLATPLPPAVLVAGDAEAPGGFDAAVARGTLAAEACLGVLARPVAPELAAAAAEARTRLARLEPFLGALARWWRVEPGMAALVAPDQRA